MPIGDMTLDEVLQGHDEQKAVEDIAAFKSQAMGAITQLAAVLSNLTNSPCTRAAVQLRQEIIAKLRDTFAG